MGHTVLAIVVPELDEVVRERTRHYDPSYVSADHRFVHAHVTVHAPWVDTPTGDDLATISSIAAATERFEITFTDLAEFPDGTIYLRPDPPGPLRRLSDRVAVAFPDHPRYDRRFPDLVPHLTLDRRDELVTPESVHVTVEHLLPLRLTADRLDLQWWANDDCRLLHSWSLA